MTPFVIGLAIVVLTLVFVIVALVLALRALRVELEQLRGEVRALTELLRPPVAPAAREPASCEQQYEADEYGQVDGGWGKRP